MQKMDNIEIKTQPSICDVLGVEVDEKFHVRFSENDIGYHYSINKQGDLLNALGNKCNEIVMYLINGQCRMERLPKYSEEVNGVIGAVRLIKEFCFNEKCAECFFKSPLGSCEVRDLGRFMPYGVVGND